MSGKLAAIYIWICVIVCGLCIGAMLLMGTAGGRPTDKERTETEGQSDKELYIWDETSPENVLQIFLPESVKQQDVSTENDYINKSIKITILKTAESESLSKAFFYENPLRGNVHMENIYLWEQADRVVITLCLQTVFEWENKFEKESGEHCMYYTFVRPKDKYERIVVLDAGHGGEDEGYAASAGDEGVWLREKDISLAIVKQTGAELVRQGVQVYYTRTDDSNPSADDRVALANMVQADMLISVHGDFSDDSSLYGLRTIYNSTYFIPNFGSADLAYLLLEKVAASTNEKAIGFEEDRGEVHLIQNAMVPVAQINVGYLSNRQEQKLLDREDYILRIAEGITDAALTGYEEMTK